MSLASWGVWDCGEVTDGQTPNPTYPTRPAALLHTPTPPALIVNPYAVVIPDTAPKPAAARVRSTESGDSGLNHVDVLNRMTPTESPSLWLQHMRPMTELTRTLLCSPELYAVALYTNRSCARRQISLYRMERERCGVQSSSVLFLPYTDSSGGHPTGEAAITVATRGPASP